MNFNSLTACAVTSIGLMALGFHGDASAISYSKAGTNSAFSASWEEATTINYTGAPIERSASGSNYKHKPQSDHFYSHVAPSLQKVAAFWPKVLQLLLNKL